MHKKSSSKAKREAARNVPEEDPEFQIAPMIDILLVLLVFFMSIGSAEQLLSSEPVDLAVAKDAKPAKKNAGQVIVNVKWQKVANVGEIVVGPNRFNSPLEIVDRLKDEVAKVPETRVLIRADRDVPFQYMRQLLKTVAEAGVANVTFSVLDKPLDS